jgi:MFS family permease
MKADAQAIAPRRVISSLGLICAAQFVLQLDFSIVNVALPTIQRDLGFAPADLQWVVTGYALTFGSLLLLGGRAGDLLGRRRLLMLGLLLFGLATLTCGLALLATLAAAHTAQTGSLVAGYGFSYLVASVIVLIAMLLVATQLNYQACQAELARQRQEPFQTRANALLPQELKKH